ncbi:MAG: DinB family protein [Planctomycetes bacterium]|nr:DinB family protein [Planctomycetota bacterium]
MANQSPRIDLLLKGLARSYDRLGWHGPVLKGALRGVKVKTALWRPDAKRNSIRDLVIHCAYWKFVVRRWLNAATATARDDKEAAVAFKAEKFQRSPINFPSRDEAVDARRWREDLKLLDDEHRKLILAVAAFPESLLDARAALTGMSYAEVIFGVSAHDLYHCGQISLFKRLALP